MKGINNINAAWEEVSENYLNGVWRQILPDFMHDFTGFEPVENIVEVISGLVQDVGLDKVTAESVTEMLYNHGQQIYSESLEEVAKELSQEKEEEKGKDEEPPLKCTKTSPLQCILSTMWTLTDELCDTDHNCEQTAKVKRNAMVSICPYSKILKERQRKS